MLPSEEEGLHILRNFNKKCITTRPSEDFRKETCRLKVLALHTMVRYGSQQERVAAEVQLESFRSGGVDVPLTVPLQSLDDNMVYQSIQRAIDRLSLVITDKVLRTNPLPATESVINNSLSLGNERGVRRDTTPGRKRSNPSAEKGPVRKRNRLSHTSGTNKRGRASTDDGRPKDKRRRV